MQTLTSLLNLFVKGAALFNSALDVNGAATFTGVTTLPDTTKVDVISERTAAHGVTIDGLSIKDGQVQIAWTNYNPTYGASPGTISQRTKSYARYSQHGSAVLLHLSLAIDIATANCDYLQISLPVNATGSQITAFLCYNSYVIPAIAVGQASGANATLYLPGGVQFPIGNDHRLFITGWYSV
jgi:hypothetical protein